MSMKPILETSLSGITSHSRGKVRDMYEIKDKLLMVTTDRISAFDVVLESGIPDKGKVPTTGQSSLYVYVSICMNEKLLLYYRFSMKIHH